MRKWVFANSKYEKVVTRKKITDNFEMGSVAPGELEIQA